MIPVKVAIGLFLVVGGVCFFIGVAAGQLQAMLLGLVILGWVAVVWYQRYGKSGTSAERHGSGPTTTGRLSPSREQPEAGFRLEQTPIKSESAQTMHSALLCEEGTQSNDSNPALEELKRLPQTAITAGLIAAIPSLTTELFAEARNQATSLGIWDANFIECIFDLELTSAFERAMAFAQDRNLVSLFIDAMVFKATGKSPSAPAGVDMMACLTHQHRGIGKYALAKKYHSVPDPSGWLFGAEYARAKGDAQDPMLAVAAGTSVLYIRRAGAWATEKALTGRTPTQQEKDVLPNALMMAGFPLSISGAH